MSSFKFFFQRKSFPSYPGTVLFLVFCLFWGGVNGQEKESYMLDSVTVTWSQARNFFKELGDVRSLLNNYTVLEIARDSILVKYMEGFKARNGIDMMTVSYIYGEQLLERVFGDPKQKQFEQASGDLIKSRIVFERKAPKANEGYYVYLEVKAGNTRVYEMFNMSEAEFDSVVNEHAAVLGTSNTIYTDPGDAHESVIQALIGALAEIEGVIKTNNFPQEIELIEDISSTVDSSSNELPEDRVLIEEEVLTEEDSLLDPEDSIQNIVDSLIYFVEIFNGENPVSAGDYLLISAVPEMPNLSVTLKTLDKRDIKVKFRLKIEYKRDIRQDEDFFPATGWFETILNKTWEIDFGDKIRGGRATLYTELGESKDTIVFHLRGANPTEQAVRDYIVEENYNETWFFTRLIRQESNYIHFNNGTNYGPKWTDSQGCPNWGPPHGWGLCQLDLLNGGQRPTAQELWSWKANVDRGYNFLTGEKFDIAENHIEGEMESVNEWNRDNPNDLVEGHDDQEEGNNINSVTYTHASSNSFNFLWGNLDAGLESFLDAVWIKSYNGNSRGYYYRLRTLSRRGEKPQWELRRINLHDHNYVGAVSGRSE